MRCETSAITSRLPAIDPRRRELGLSGAPTDVELECLAQTWSEHCKHKIFNATIDYREGDGQPRRIDSLFRQLHQARVTEEIDRPAGRDRRRSPGWSRSFTTTPASSPSTTRSTWSTRSRPTTRRRPSTPTAAPSPASSASTAIRSAPAAAPICWSTSGATASPRRSTRELPAG